MKLIEPGKRPLVYSDFEDRIGAATEVTVTGLSVGTDFAAFRRKARVFLKSYENHITILKLRRHEPLTPTDLAELERIFAEAEVDEASIDRLKVEGGLAGSCARWWASIETRQSVRSPIS